MAKKKSNIVYMCRSCGNESPKWLGRCPGCGSWDSMIEQIQASSRAVEDRFGQKAVKADPVPVTSVTFGAESRLSTGISEFDRVLGGGLVEGSLVLIGGDPGIGKSTLMLQVMHGLCKAGTRALYVSGEESVRQISMRSRRLSTLSDNLFVLAEIDLAGILAAVDNHKPDVLVVDSIQTMYNAELGSAPGSVGQVRESAMRLMMLAKRTGVPVFIVGHVTKEGAIAGPRLLEHMVDTVLYFEGDGSHVFRILRAVKNRFGSTNEIGVFEMKNRGLVEVPNPSAMFLSERATATAGSVVTCSMEGTRPILVELQALTSATSFGTPRRTILGLDQNRVALLAAVLEKQLGLQLIGHDMFMNVAGGVKIVEPAVDLAVIAAIAGSFLDKPVPDGTIILGEVGLTGEVRGISQMDHRLSEIVKMGFTRCILPKTGLSGLTGNDRITLLGVTNVAEASELLF